MILADAVQALPEGYPWVAGGWSCLGFIGGYSLGRLHCWLKKRKRTCD